MRYGNLAFTAVFLKARHGYVGFVEELPQIMAHAMTLEEARKSLNEVAAVIFDAERASARELLADREVVREQLVIPFPARTRGERPPGSSVALRPGVDARDPEREVAIAHVGEPRPLDDRLHLLLVRKAADRLSYAIGQLLEQAVNATGTLDHQRLARYLRTNEMTTIVGPVRYRKDGEWANPRIITTQFQGVRDKDLEQFRKPGVQVILHPDSQKSGTLRAPFEKAQA